VVRDGVAATVEIQAGPHRIVSLITSEAVDELGLAPGIIADAAVKATDVMVDVAPL
jgi:molybdopterin-binding protein